MMTQEEVRMTGAGKGYGYRSVPVCRELYSDQRTPIQVLRILKAVSSHCFLLESVEESRQWGRYTFLGYDPAMEIICRGEKAVITGADGIREEEIPDLQEDIETARRMVWSAYGQEGKYD